MGEKGGKTSTPWIKRGQVSLIANRYKRKSILTTNNFLEEGREVEFA
jgi:hypothetical protein